MNEALTANSLLETRGTSQALGAYVVAVMFDRARSQAAFGLGDGTLRVASLAAPAEWTSVPAHDGAVLALVADVHGNGFISGGDDGRLVRTAADRTTHEIAGFGGKWVEQAASFSDGKSQVFGCSVGKVVHVFAADGSKLKQLQHPSTVTGIAFDGRGKRIAASHYNGASLWFIGSNATTPRTLDWKGSHTAVAVHPAAEAVVTAMQENALHGWRLPDGHDMRMSGYPSKPQSLGFTRSGKYLASAGADAIVLWPFFGGGPTGKPPVELAQIENVICTRIACHPTDDGVVAAGFANGTVVLAEIATKRLVRVAPSGHGPISALAWSGDGAWLAFGTEDGFAALVDFSPQA